MRGLLVGLVATGCYQPSPPSGAACADNGACPSGLSCIGGFCVPDVDAAPPPCGFASHYFDVCALPAAGAIKLTTMSSPYSIDTSGNGTFLRGKANTHFPITTMLIDQGGTEAYVLIADGFAIDPGVEVRASGDRPLIIVSRGPISIDGALDVNGVGATPGAGSNSSTLCGASAAAGGSDGVGGAGGAGGGAFQAAGGSGGSGDMDTGPKPGGGGGIAVEVPTIVRGGCNGANGGSAGFGNAAGGAGGGAVLLTSGVGISIAGTVNAGGGGGSAGTNSDGGGGGGGAGGLIGLEAPAIAIFGGIAANGGGGGEGNQAATTVLAGSDGAVSTTGAAGGNSGTCGTAGGAGGASEVPAGVSVSDIDTCGGGGGGGGVGFILVWTRSLALINATISPEPISNPF